MDITRDIPNITAPTLVMTSTNSGYYGSTQELGNWQKNIPDSELVLIPGDSYHISASYPDACASKAAHFLARWRKNAFRFSPVLALVTLYLRSSAIQKVARD